VIIEMIFFIWLLGATPNSTSDSDKCGTKRGHQDRATAALSFRILQMQPNKKEGRMELRPLCQKIVNRNFLPADCLFSSAQCSQTKDAHSKQQQANRFWHGRSRSNIRQDKRIVIVV